MRYLTAAAAVAAAAAVTAATWPLCAPTPEAFFFAAVMVASWAGGVGPTLLATTLSIAASTFFFRAPYRSVLVDPKSAEAIVVFAIVSLFIGACSAARLAVEARERATRRRFGEIATSIADAVVTVDAKGRVNFLNAAAERLAGVSAAEATGRPVRDVLDLRPESAAAALDGLPAAGPPRRFEQAVLVGRDGVERPVEGSVAPIVDEAGVVVGSVLSFLDVGDRLEAQTALLRTEALNREILDAGPDCLKLLALDGRILSINEQGRRLLEVDDADALRGRNWVEFWPETVRGQVREAVGRAAAGAPAVIHAMGPTFRGVVKDWEVHLTPVLGVDGRPERIYCISRDVTERTRAESELLASQERYRALFDSMDEGFCVFEMILDDQGRAVDYLFLEANPAFAVHTGLSDVVGKRIRELVPDHDEHWLETYSKVASTGEPVRFLDRPEHLGASWFELYAFPLGGRKVAVLFKNVTAAMQAEQERERLLLDLKHERAKLEGLIEEAPAIICTLRGPEHRYELANRLYYDIVGGRELIGRTVREALPELEGQGFFELLDEVYRTGQPYVGKETPVLLRRGGDAPERRILNFVFQATREADGRVSGIFVHGVDVTDMVAAREAVSESESRFRQLADAMPQAVWAAQADGVVDYFNRKWREHGGYPEGVLGGPSWARVIHPDDLEAARVAWMDSVRTGKPFEVEYRLLRASDGTYRWHLGRALPIQDSRGQIVRWFGTSTDVDDVKRLSEALKQADRRKDEFLATLAHELRNPLAPIHNGLEILEMGASEEGVRSTVDMMSRQLGHMVHLIDDLMDVARVRSGKIKLKRQRVTLQSIAAGAVEACRQAVQSAGHSLSAAIPPEPIPLDADPTRLTQVIANLLNNAAKYTEHGGRVELDVRRDGVEAVVSVRDTGVGIAPEMLPKVFDMFAQEHSSIARSQGGLGIGLTVVKRLVEMHGGRIEARSAGPGRGSEFLVRLPVADAPHEEAKAGGDAGCGRAPAGGIRVLVVDDNRDAANSLSRLLALDGHDVHTAYDGGQAIAEAAAFPPDVILLDLGLPDKNGLEVAAELRSRPDLRDAMIVALTGWGQPEDRRRTREAGFDHHMVKPVDLDSLRKILAAVAVAAREA